MSQSSAVYNVEPRYTPGSPAAVSPEIATRVAEQEREGHETALSGVRGEAEKAKAAQLGLSLIAFTMTERPRGWEVTDLITGERHFWPFKANCPKCLDKGVQCRRGKIIEHNYVPHRHSGIYPCPGAALYIGTSLEPPAPRAG